MLLLKEEEFKEKEKSGDKDDLSLGERLGIYKHF